MQKREQWIDLARGILILMVVFFHLPILTRSLANNLETPVVMQVSSIYLPFFIPAFFVITGMCSNFSYIVKDFVISNTKHLIIPMLSLSFFARVIGWNIYDWSDFCSVEGWSYAVVGYFILSLLISKSIYYFLHFINLSLYWRGLITLLLLLLGIVMNKCGIYNFLYFENALIFTFFIWLGDFLRNIHWERYAKYSLLVYLLLYVCMYVCRVGIPYVMLSICVSYLKIPLYLLLSVTGCLAIMWIARCLSHCRLIEQIGKNTLIIYYLHSSLLLQLGSILSSHIIVDSVLQYIILEMLLFVLTIVVCQVVGHIFTLPYLNLLIGRF